MDKVCIDASIALAWLTHDRHSVAANTIGSKWLGNRSELLVPESFHSEVLFALNRYVSSGSMLETEGNEAFSILVDMPFRVVSGDEIHRTIWRLARETRLAIPWLFYLSVAEAEDCDYWTADKEFADKIGATQKRVHWLGEVAQPLPLPSEPPRKAEPEKTKARYDSPKLDDPGLWRRM